jgi:hypothetical protein
MRRILGTAVALTLLAGALTTAARADGDPASDVLFFQDVFLPYVQPSADVTKKLNDTVAAANKAGFQIKVAVVQSEQDLGSVPSLFNRQELYARFLGTELRLFYKDRLLVVMPAGFGIYHNGLTVDRETAALAGIAVDSADSDGLANAAIAAVTSLRNAIGTPAKKDSVPPTVKALVAKGSKGKPAVLHYTVFDSSGRSKEIVRVYGPALLLFTTIVTKYAKAKPRRAAKVTWRVPLKLETTKLQFCVVAEDLAGNQSKASCAPIRIS